ncbi:MAG: winged helix-turn-helix domain-containing protein [Anaerolineae bacterium]|nr:winged helix-turn-helix domain-containing protein [Anaerolineae bacterium]
MKQQLRAFLDALRILFSSLLAEQTSTSEATPGTSLEASPEDDQGPRARDAGEAAGQPSVWQRLQEVLRPESRGHWPVREAIPGPVRLPESWEAPGLETDAPVEAREEALSSALFVVYCLGPFRVYVNDQPVEDWQSRRGKSIFKYLVTHRERPTPKEVLMELFWPDSLPDAARNNLNVAIYGLRQTLRQDNPAFPHVLFQDDCYFLNPELQVWTDFEAFLEHFETAQEWELRGDLAAAIRAYQTADPLYQGEFMEEDRYEDWPIALRERFREAYLQLLDRLSSFHLDRADYTACATACNKMLHVDNCHEGAHRRLMRCYSRQGQRYLALRQYYLCVETLRRELDVDVSQSTLDLYERIQRRQRA